MKNSLLSTILLSVNVKLSRAEFSNHFTGVALEVWSEVKFEKSNNENTISLYETLKHISGIKGALVKIFALSMLIELIALLMPIGTQLVMDHVMQAKDQSLLLIICIGLFLFTFFAQWSVCLGLGFP